jgi:NADH-quinone oxidoreductase subunit D
MARSCGLKKDLRLSITDSYSNYNNIFFKSYFGVNGDCFDRYLIRMLEMGESLHISNSIINNLLSADNKSTIVASDIYNLCYFNNESSNYTSMEDLINHFLS